jgi:hypothetical protein
MLAGAILIRVAHVSISLLRFPMHEFQVLVTFVVIGAVYVGLFLAAEKFWMK